MPEFPLITVASLTQVLDDFVLQGELVGTVAGGSSPVTKPSQQASGTYTSCRFRLNDGTGYVTCWVNDPPWDPLEMKGRKIRLRPRQNGKGQWAGVKKITGKPYNGKTEPELRVYGECIELLDGPASASGSPRTAAPAATQPQAGRPAPMSLGAAEDLFAGIFARALAWVEAGRQVANLDGDFPLFEVAQRAQAMATTLMIALLDGKISPPSDSAPTTKAAPQSQEDFDDDIPF